VIRKNPENLVTRNKFLQETPGQIYLKLIKPGLSQKKPEMIVSLSTENGVFSHRGRVKMAVVFVRNVMIL